MNMGSFELDSRSIEVLTAVIESYIEKNEPIGSRTITKKYDFNLSPATIRNVMADLEQAGFLSQPHTSAGRVPSDKGYRLYAETVVNHKTLVVKEKNDIHSATFSQETCDLKEMVTSVTEALSELSMQAGLMGLTSWSATPIKKVHFVHIENRLTLSVMVAVGGEMKSQLVRTEENFSQDTLGELSNYFNDRFSGLTLKQIRTQLLNEINNARNRMDSLISIALAIAEGIEDQAPHNSDETIFIKRTSNLIGQQSSGMSLQKIKALFRTLDEKEKLAQLLNECMKSNGVNLLIGGESEIEELEDFSLITHPFHGRDGTAIGSVGIIGLKRMDYGHIMALVSYTAAQVSLRLAGRSYEAQN